MARRFLWAWGFKSHRRRGGHHRARAKRWQRAGLPGPDPYRLLDRLRRAPARDFQRLQPPPNNFTEVFTLLGLGLPGTPEVRGFSPEAGRARGGGANDQTTVVTENGTHYYAADVDRCVSYGDHCDWETFHEWREYSTGSRGTSPRRTGGPRGSFRPSIWRPTRPSMRPGACASRRARHFMHNLKMEATDTARVAPTFKF